MKSFKTRAHINSLHGEMDDVTIIQPHYMFGHRIDNSYIVDYKGTICTGLFNWFTEEYYVDDVYGIMEQYEQA